MPAARADEQYCGLGIQLVLFAFGRGVFNGAAHRVVKIALSLNIVGPSGRVRVLEIGHEDAGAGVEGVDGHLAVGRASDFHPSIEQVGGNRRHFPRSLSGGASRFKEMRQLSGVESRLAVLAFLQQRLSHGFEARMQRHQKFICLRSQDGGLCIGMRPSNADGFSLSSHAAPLAKLRNGSRDCTSPSRLCRCRSQPFAGGKGRRRIEMRHWEARCRFTAIVVHDMCQSRCINGG